MKISPRRAVLVLAGAQVDLVVADAGLLRVAGPAIGQPAAAGDVAVDDLLGDLDRLGLGARPSCRRRRRRRIGDGVERLAQLRAVAVQGVGLEHQLPAQQVGLLDVLDGGLVRHVDRLGDRPGDERLGGGHHADVRLGRQEALADLAALVGAVEDRVVLGLQVRRAFDGHGAADVGRWPRRSARVVKPRCVEQVEAGRVELLLREAERVLAGSRRRASSG